MALKDSLTAADNACMPQDGNETVALDAPPANAWNEYTAPDMAESQYVPPSASIPAEYWQQSAEAKVRANGYDTSTVGVWVFVLLGLILPIFALGGGMWALFMSRDDSRFLIPAAVGFGIVARPFLF